MGLTSSMYTAMSGLNSNQFRIDVIGDNIANVNTTAFKSSRAMFQTQFARTLSSGSGPGVTLGGTNPLQVGMGSITAATQRDFGQGNMELTGVPTDLAIEGGGLFILSRGDNDRVYTRDGSFRLDANNYLVSQDGYYVQGYGVDGNYSLNTGVITNLQIPLGVQAAAQATQNANFDGNLNAAGDVATTGNTLLSDALVTDDAGTVAAQATNLLTSIRNGSAPTVSIFASGDTLTLSGATRDGREVPDSTFTVTDTTTLQDLMDWLQGSLGIQAGVGAGTAGITVDSSGRIQIIANAGVDNAVEIESADLASTNADFQLTFTESAAADGESVHSSFIIFDSLGSPVQVDITLVKESVAGGSTTWRFYVDSEDDVSGYPVATGTLTFDTDGRLIASDGTTITIDRSGTGAASPLTTTLNFQDVTQLSDPVSTVVMTTQDGFAPGTLAAFSIGNDGIITGTFSNGLTRTLGQVMLATFTNYEGMVALTDNLLTNGPNAGEPIIAAPTTMGAGRIASGMLEMSNVDLSREFIGLISASTGFSAAGRVISTSDQLLRELLTLAR
jgi:flagellar hook protein FlgE